VFEAALQVLEHRHLVSLEVLLPAVGADIGGHAQSHDVPTVPDELAKVSKCFRCGSTEIEDRSVEAALGITQISGEDRAAWPSRTSSAASGS